MTRLPTAGRHERVVDATPQRQNVGMPAGRGGETMKTDHST